MGLTNKTDKTYGTYSYLQRGHARGAVKVDDTVEARRALVAHLERVGVRAPEREALDEELDAGALRRDVGAGRLEDAPWHRHRHRGGGRGEAMEETPSELTL